MPTELKRLGYKDREVAEMLGVQTSTVRRWIDEGRVSVFRIGRTVRIHADEVERLTTPDSATS